MSNRLRRLLPWICLAAACRAPAAPSASTEPRILEAPKPRRQGTLRVLVSHDMEGLSGQDDWRTFLLSHPAEYRRGQQLLAGDVNAVIDGLFAGGATAVDVFDQHGSGQPDSIPDLPPALLDPRARQVFMSEAISADAAARGDYDALVVVGAHARTGSAGFASHTYTLGITIAFNGLPVTETEMTAYQWGQFGVPLILATGDDRLCRDLAPEPWVGCVAVKKSTGVAATVLRPVDDARRDMRAAATRALEHLGESKVMRLTVPVRIAIRALPPATFGGLQRIPGLGTGPDEVTFVNPDFGPSAFERIGAVIEVATLLGRHQVLTELLAATPAGRSAIAAHDSAYFQRWIEAEGSRGGLDDKR